MCLRFFDLTHFRGQGRNIILFVFWFKWEQENLLLKFTDLQSVPANSTQKQSCRVALEKNWLTTLNHHQRHFFMTKRSYQNLRQSFDRSQSNQRQFSTGSIQQLVIKVTRVQGFSVGETHFQSLVNEKITSIRFQKTLYFTATRSQSYLSNTQLS